VAVSHEAAGRPRFDIILLDADGTIFDYDAAETHALTASLAEYGRPCGPAALLAYRRINGLLWQAHERGEIGLADLRVERMRRFAAAIGADLPAAEFGERYVAQLSGAGFLIEGALELVRQLRVLVGRTGRMALLTNGIEQVQRSRLAASPIRPYIDALLTSQSLGFQKPDPRCFAGAFRRLGLDPEDPIARARAIMLGDSLSSDIKGGLDFGIATCWYNPGGALRTDDIRPDAEIQKLGDFLELVGIPD
jgi:2-haloacid dehalogenase